MYVYGDRKSGSTINYLSEQEKEALKVLEDYSVYLNSQGMEDNLDSRIQYLKDSTGEQESTHTAAFFSGKLAERLSLDFNKESQTPEGELSGIDKFKSLAQGQWYGDKKEFEEITGTKIYKDGQMIKRSDNAKLTTPLVLTVNRDLSIMYAKETRAGQKAIVKNVLDTHSEIQKERAKALRPSSKDYINLNDLSKEQIENLSAEEKSKVYIPAKTETVEAIFTHYGSRNNDPHLHFHIEQCPGARFEMLDGSARMLATDNEELLNESKEHTAKFNYLLSRKIANDPELKYNISASKDPKTNFSFEIDGVSKELRTDLSTRKKDILTEQEKWIETELSSMDKYLSDKEKRTANQSIRSKTAKGKDELNSDQEHLLIKEKTLTALDKTDSNGKTRLDNLNEAQAVKKTIVKDGVEQSVGNISLSGKGINAILKDQDMRYAGELTETKIRAKVASYLMNNTETNFKTLEELNGEIDKTINTLIKDNLLIEKSELKKSRVQKVLRKGEDGEEVTAGLEQRNFTTIYVAKAERNVLNRVRKMVKHDGTYQVDEKKLQLLQKFEDKLPAQYKLTDERREACSKICSNASVIKITGAAGASKTQTVIKSGVEIEQESGRKVLGLCIQKLTANAMQKVGIDSKSTQSNAEFISKFYNEETDQWKTSKLNQFRDTTIFLDEAGLCGAEQMDNLLKIVGEDRNNRIVLIGDTSQLNSIGAGSSFKDIDRVLPEQNQALMLQVARQKTDEGLLISNSIREHDTQTAIQTLKAIDGLHTTKAVDDYKADKQLDKMIVDRYFKSQFSVEDKIVIADTNKAVNNLNDEIRTQIIRNQDIAKEEAVKSGASYDDSNDISKSGYVVNVKDKSGSENERIFSKNDQIIFTAPTELENKEKIANSSRGTIKDIFEKEGKTYFNVEIKQDNGEKYIAEIQPEKNNTFNHGYCSTSMSAQGVTCKESFYKYDGDRPAYSQNLYVVMTRAEEKCNLFCREDDISKVVEYGNVMAVKASTLDDNKINQAVADFDSQEGMKTTFRTDPVELNRRNVIAENYLQHDINVKSIKEAELTPEQIDKQQRDNEQLDKKIADSVKGASSVEEASHIQKVVIMENLNEKWKKEAEEKQVKANEWKPEPMPSEEQQKAIDSIIDRTNNAKNPIIKDKNEILKNKETIRQEANKQTSEDLAKAEVLAKAIKERVAGKELSPEEQERQRIKDEYYQKIPGGNSGMSIGGHKR